ncbi:hypothetical protein [Abyssisolibacter fermentans]|uniref:Kae1-like domain-containing protein n=1 Tax=Abyssisolibacter fermentans TaxID=1766203 RepID=UPI000831EE36|nr:hypothetical protein [Abyssisolibacter fermentans]
MSQNKLYLGIDTSAYKTSIAIIDDVGKVVCDLRKLLDVKKGSRGLRQQEAVFQHLNNLPDLFEKAREIIDYSNIINVVASTRPRNVEGSYMPVFNVSKVQAQIISSLLDVPIINCSHQDGHIGAALLGCNKLAVKDFLLFHISGGTTELLNVHRVKPFEFKVKVIGGTKDISCGQLIDRIGVKMGLEFPSGIELEKLAMDGVIIPEKLPQNIDKTWINYSGAETYFYKLIDKSYKASNIARSVLYVVAKTLSSSVLNAIKDNSGIKSIIFAGGVASNIYIRDLIKEDLSDKLEVYFPDIKYCSDNAVGNAYLGYMRDLY